MGVPVVVLLVLGVCVAAGYAMKGIAGFGEIIPLVAVGQLLVDRADLVVVATLLSLAGGLVAVRLIGTVAWHEIRHDAARLALGAAAGVVLGALAPAVLVRGAFAVTLFGASVALLRASVRARSGLPAPTAHADPGALVTAAAVAAAPARAGAEPAVLAAPGQRIAGPRPTGRAGARWSPYGVAAAGVTGGIAGVDGPPLAASLAVRGGDFRPALVTLLVVSSSFRLVLLTVSGAVHAPAVLATLALLPLAGAGFVIGRRYAAGIEPPTVVRVAAAIAVVGSVLALLAP